MNYAVSSTKPTQYLVYLTKLTEKKSVHILLGTKRHFIKFDALSARPTSTLQSSVLSDDEIGPPTSNPQTFGRNTNKSKKEKHTSICNQRIIGAGNQFPVTFTPHAAQCKNVQRSSQTAIKSNKKDSLVTDCTSRQCTDSAHLRPK